MKRDFIVLLYSSRVSAVQKETFLAREFPEEKFNIFGEVITHEGDGVPEASY